MNVLVSEPGDPTVGEPAAMGPPETVARWHEIVVSRDRSALRALLAPEAVFRSPAVHAPQEGAERAYAYLAAALEVLGPSLTYHREWYRPGGAVLEFTAELDGLDVHGVDIIGWNAEGQITSFEVMVR
ncbi:MAG TPA: nuclear transport factor 2 family protein, partial [Solirubrobacteraceae bacterium]|nr:nuclear transport factor 2 family protein [Solirubrobacteraceae bacterium]